MPSEITDRKGKAHRDAIKLRLITDDKVEAWRAAYIKRKSTNPLAEKSARITTSSLARPCPVPASAGVYAWLFDSCPQGVPTVELVRSVGQALLYVGISPKPPNAVASRGWLAMSRGGSENQLVPGQSELQC